MLSSCSTCQNPDGSPNLDELDEHGSCAFGCGLYINSDDDYCPRCEDHSANEYECEDCGLRYDTWSGQWRLDRRESRGMTDSGERQPMSLNERRAEFVYDAARLAAIAAGAPIIPVPWAEREDSFRAQFLTVIERQCGPQRSSSPEELHGSWMQAYLAMGWTYGEIYDREKRVHPDLVPYASLGQLERDKDAVFVALCEIARLYVYEGAGRSSCGGRREDTVSDPLVRELRLTAHILSSPRAGGDEYPFPAICDLLCRAASALEQQAAPTTEQIEAEEESLDIALKVEWDRVTAYWPPEWIQSPDHIEKLIGSLASVAAALAPRREP